VPATTVAINKQGKEITDFVFNAQSWVEDIALIWDMGFMVDKDNEPTPNNISALFGALAPVNAEGLFKGQVWG
jgi:hypothetical protein